MSINVSINIPQLCIGFLRCDISEFVDPNVAI